MRAAELISLLDKSRSILGNDIIMKDGSHLYWMDLFGNVLKEELRSERRKD